MHVTTLEVMLRATLDVGGHDRAFHSRAISLIRTIMNRVAIVSLSIVALALPQCATAHPYDFEGWFSTNAHIALDDDKTYHMYLEAQPRQGNNFKRFGLFQGRVAINYNISRAVGLYVGYAWVPTFFDANYHRTYRDEQRVWQQVTYRHELLGIQWQHRFRQEQRMIMHTKGVSHRTRYLLKGSYPLLSDSSFGLTSFNEIMFNLNQVENGPWTGYDRNRFFVGPYWQRGHGRYEVGYLGEHAKRFGTDERWAHVLAVQIAYTF